MLEPWSAANHIDLQLTAEKQLGRVSASCFLASAASKSSIGTALPWTLEPWSNKPQGARRGGGRQARRGSFPDGGPRSQCELLYHFRWTGFQSVISSRPRPQGSKKTCTERAAAISSRIIHQALLVSDDRCRPQPQQIQGEVRSNSPASSLTLRRRTSCPVDWVGLSFEFGLSPMFSA